MRIDERKGWCSSLPQNRVACILTLNEYSNERTAVTLGVIVERLIDRVNPYRLRSVRFKNVWQYQDIESIRTSFALEAELFLDRGAVVGGHDGCQRQVVTAFALRQLVLCADG